MCNVEKWYILHITALTPETNYDFPQQVGGFFGMRRSEKTIILEETSYIDWVNVTNNNNKKFLSERNRVA